MSVFEGFDASVIENHGAIGNDSRVDDRVLITSHLPDDGWPISCVERTDWRQVATVDGKGTAARKAVVRQESLLGYTH